MTTIFTTIFTIFILLAPIAIIIFIVFYTVKKKGQQTDALKAFAEKRGFSFAAGKSLYAGDFVKRLTEIGPINKQGMLFVLGTDKLIRNSVGGRAAGFDAWLYQYQFTTGSGKSRRTHYYTVCEIKIGNRLPHVIIDSKETGRGVSSYVSQSLQKSNIINVTSGFEEDFTLYAQTGLEQEALEIFTTDVLEKIKTYSKTFDIELIGDTMYLYSNKVSVDEKFYSYMFDTGAYLAGQLRKELKEFKMPEILTKPGADFKEVRQITKMTKRQKVISSTISATIIILYVIFRILLLD